MINRLNFIFTILLCCIWYGVIGQEAHKKNWQHLDLDADRIFGVSADKAYRKLGTKKGVKVIVAIIDGGVDTTHEALKGKFWTNSLEIPGNQIDDDKNGYIDDIHGWNFLGSTKGSFQFDNFDLIRQLRWAKEKSDTSAETKELKQQVNDKRAAVQDLLNKATRERELLNEIISHIGKTIPSENDFRNYRYKSFEQERFLVKLVRELKRIDLNTFTENLSKVADGYKEQLKYWLNLDYNPRAGNDFLQPYYGNADVMGTLSYHATHVAGIIAGTEIGSSHGVKGISRNVQIMILRTIGTGDILDTEMAKAIRYATDNGAKVINISAGKRTSTNSDVIDKAVQYAMQKDVLIVHGCGNESMNLQQQRYYPRKDYQTGGRAMAWLEVGGADQINDESLLSLSSNYGKTVVDVFAPGVNIYSCVPDNRYAYLTGTSMATPVVSAVAAVIRSYYPKLSAETVKNIIMESVKKVKHSVKTLEGTLIPFTETCATGGIVNLYDALELATKK